jgi:predicted nucleic acid-binding protein
MTLLYLDASAWVKRHFQEDGSDWVNQQFEKGMLMGASTLGLIEVAATCARKRAAGAIDATRFQQIELDLLDDWEGMFQVDLTAETVERSLEVARTRALRGSDCTHLASAVILKELLAIHASKFAMVTSDRELKAAALKTGLTVFDPQEEQAKASNPAP